MVEDISILVNKVQNGDKEAFGEIYKLYLGKIYRFIYFSLYDRQLAEDLTQETFLKAWRAIGSFSSDRGTFQAFLFAIARNLTVDHWRKKKDISLEAIPEIISPESVEEKFFRKEESQRVANALKILDDFEKQIIILRYFEELSFSEIAGVVDQNEGALRVRIHRILKKLKKYIEVHK